MKSREWFIKCLLASQAADVEAGFALKVAFSVTRSEQWFEARSASLYRLEPRRTPNQANQLSTSNKLEMQFSGTRQKCLNLPKPHKLPSQHRLDLSPKPCLAMRSSK